MHARSLVDTADLVQETLMRVLQGMDRIEVCGPGGFQAYVRQAVLNRTRDEVRWAARRPGGSSTPTFVFVNRSGVVRGYTPTRLTDAELDRHLAPILR